MYINEIFVYTEVVHIFFYIFPLPILFCISLPVNLLQLPNDQTSVFFFLLILID